MKDELVSFETAKLAKEKGFDEPCSHYYVLDFQNFKADGVLHKTGLPNDYDSNNILQFVKRTNQPHLSGAPTQSLLQRWLREEHEIFIEVTFVDSATNDWFGRVCARDIMSPVFEAHTTEEHKTYEDALEEGLLEALKLLN